jgi:hypothetical protein
MKKVFLLPFLLSLLFFLIAGSQHAGLVAARKRYHLQVVPPEDTTPLVAITTVAFGGFRGLVADALWVRANELQDNGQFFELVQLATWISQLEPHVPEVWSFQAWNLAYNISVFFPDPEDRWRWVNHGINLLRNEGLRHNPTSAALHWDIGWMYQHKIGMEMDQAHHTYKRRLAESVQNILGGPFLNLDTLTPDQRAAFETTFRMDLDFMRELDALYGPIDWRLPAAHSLYWSARGEPLARDSFRRRSLQRMRMQSLSDLLRRGRVLGDPATAAFIPLPRLELLDILLGEFSSATTAQPNNPPLRNAYQSFLRDSLLLFAEYGDIDKAWSLYQRLAASYPASDPASEPAIDPSQDAFLAIVKQYNAIHPSELSREQALTRIVAQLSRSAALKDEDPSRAAFFRQSALQIHRLFQESRRGEEHRIRTELPDLEVIETLLREIP